MTQVLADRYELRTRIGSGGTATVWNALDRRLGRGVAVKVLSESLVADERFRRRFEREAHHIASLSHPNIVVVHDFGAEADQLFIVMELVRGKTLRQLLAEPVPLEPPMVAKLAADVLAGLGHAHEADIFHRDIKPANILVTESGIAKLADFGIARAAEETVDLTDSGAILGTVSYASPEQLSGQPIGPPSDLYSLGCVLYECMAGRPPFVADNIAALVSQQQFAAPDPLQDPSPKALPGLCVTIMRALEKDPGRRFASAHDMRAAFKVVGTGAGYPPPSPAAGNEGHTATHLVSPSPTGVPFGRETGFLTIENVAILFTDVVGSTALSQRMPPEVADEVRRTHFSILRQALAEAGGTEVKNLGDGLMVVFDSASVAMSCGVAMQQRVEQENRDREHSVGLRVGLSMGEVTRENDDYFGDPVVEAARLCATCESGQILATDKVRGIAGRRGHHEYRSLGPLALKGLHDPVEIVEVVWEPFEGADTGTSIPLPSRLAVHPSAGVVGRETEMAAMTDATKRVAGGEGREVLLVSGEAGLGKTTLVAEAARAAFDAGACVLFGHCEEDLATPYQLFAEALGHYVTHATEDQILAHVEAHGSELSRLVPALVSRSPDLPPSKATDSDTERFLLFSAVVGLLATAAQHQPVVLVLDDLQWADRGSLLLLRHLTAAEHSMRLLILGAYRDSELSQSHGLREALGVLRQHRGVSRIELTGLDDTGVVSLMEAAAGHSLDDAGVGLAHAVYRETDGNPFFVGEVLRHLSETGAIYQDATGRWAAEDSLEQVDLPDSVREVIGGRVVRLGPDTQRVLSLAAVIGRDFDLDLLARATKTSEDELLDILEAASAAALVREPADTPGHYNFAHALIQHTLYEDMGLTRRARAHHSVAEALEDLCGERPGARVGELARHWFSATQPKDLAKALDYSHRAADAALAALAPDDALRYYCQALEIVAEIDDPDPAVVLALGIGLGTAQRQTGNAAYRDTLLGAARQAARLGNTERLVAATLANDRGFFSAAGAIDAEKVEILETALVRLPAGHLDRAFVLASLCTELTFGPLERRTALADEALAIARASLDDASIVRVLNQLMFPIFVPQLLERSMTQTAEALARAERVGDPVLLFWAATLRQPPAGCAGDIDEVDRCAELAGSLAEQLNQPALTWAHTVARATRSMLAGDADQAEQLATEALQIGTDGGEPDAAAFFGTQVMIVAFQRGTMGDLIPLIKQATAENPGLPVYLAALALAYAEADQIDKAAHLLEKFAATNFNLPLDLTWLTAMVSYAAIASECRDPKAALSLLGYLGPFAHLVATDGLTTLGPVSHVLGGLATVVGRYDEAEASFAQSVAFSDRIGAKFFAARTQLSWGRMLLERKAPGDAESARVLLTRAFTAAEANGYGVVERRAAEALGDLD